MTSADDLACRTFVALITDYLEGTLADDTARRVREHLAECPPCSEYLEQMQRTIRALGEVPVESLSERARTDIVDAFRSFGRPA